MYCNSTIVRLSGDPFQTVKGGTISSHSSRKRERNRSRPREQVFNQIFLKIGERSFLLHGLLPRYFAPLLIAARKKISHLVQDWKHSILQSQQCNLWSCKEVFIEERKKVTNLSIDLKRVSTLGRFPSLPMSSSSSSSPKLFNKALRSWTYASLPIDLPPPENFLRPWIA